MESEDVAMTAASCAIAPNYRPFLGSHQDTGCPRDIKRDLSASVMLDIVPCCNSRNRITLAARRCEYIVKHRCKSRDYMCVICYLISTS